MLAERHCRERPPSSRYSRDNPATPTIPRGARLAHSCQKCADLVRAHLQSFLFLRKYRGESPRGLNCPRSPRVFPHSAVPARAWRADQATTMRLEALPEMALSTAGQCLRVASQQLHFHEVAAVAGAVGERSRSAPLLWLQ